MEPLALQLGCAVPQLSARGHEILALLANSGARIQSADSVALRLGLHSRHQVARALRREGLPQIEELCAWIKVLHLLLEWEHTHRSLLTLARKQRYTRPPATVSSSESPARHGAKPARTASLSCCSAS